MDKPSGPKVKSITSMALFLCLLIQGCDNSDKTETEYLAAAKDFYLKDNYQAGIIELKNALRKNPDNAEARRLLGEINAKLGAGATAEKELRQAMELGVAREAVAQPLAEALLQQAKYNEVLDEITADISIDSAMKAILLSYRGDAWLALNKLDAASTEYEHAGEENPKAYQPKLGLARLALAANRPDDAMELANRALRLAPDEPRIFVFKASLYETRKEFDKAEAMYTEVISHSKGPSIYHLNRALMRLDLGKLDAASADLEEGKKISPNNYLTKLVEGRVKLAQGKYEEAEAALNQSLKLNPKYSLTRYYLAEANLLSNHLEQADKNISQLLSAMPGSPPALLLKATTKYRLGDFETAKQALDPLLRQEPDNVFFLRQMAAIEVGMGNSAEALAYLEKAGKHAPSSQDTQARLGLSLLAEGQTEKALAVMRRAAELQPDPEQALLLLFIGELQGKNFAKAKALVEDFEKKHPNDPLPSNLKGLLALAQKDRTSAKKFFEAAVKISPGDVKALVNLAALAAADRQPQEAHRYFEQVLKYHPENVQAQMGLALMAAKAGEKQQLESELRRAVELSPNTLGPRIVLARYYLRFGNPRLAEPLLEEVRTVHSSNPEWLAVLTETQMALGNSAHAVTTAQTLVNSAPKSPAGQYLLAMALGEAGDKAGMHAALAKSLELSPGYLPAQIALARAQARAKNWTEADKTMKNLQSKHPEDPEVLGVAGWLALLEGKLEKAVAAYRSAYAKEPKMASAVALSNALFAAGHKDEALALLRDWVERNDSDIGGHHALGLLYARLGQTSEARRQFERGLELNPRDSSLLTDLAGLIRAEELDKALGYAEEAVNLSPRAPAYRANLGLLLLQTGDVNRALSQLREAVRLAPKRSAFRLALAQGEAKAGNKSEAVEILRTLVKSAPLAERESAETLLKELEED